MKKLLLLALVVLSMTLQAQVKVGDNPTTVHSSSLLELESTTKGLLPPRMTSDQMNDIATPATGLHVFCSNCSPAALHFFNGTAWAPVGGTSSGGSSSSGGVSASMAINGTYTWGATHTGRTIVITISNQSFSAVTWTNAIADLVLSGGNSGLTVGTPTAVGFPIASGGTGTITFTLTGSVDTMDEITATWTKLALTVVGTQAITPGSATFTKPSNNVFVFSADASGVNVAGTLPVSTTVAIPYTSGVGKYAAYTSPDTPIASAHCNDGASDWTFAYSYPAGTFATSGNLTATLITKKAGAITAWPAKQVTDIATLINDATWSPIVVNGNNLGSSFTVGIDYGGDAIRGQLTTRAAAYDAATVSTWVNITTAEYNLLAGNIPGVIKRGLTDSQISATWSTQEAVFGDTSARTMYCEYYTDESEKVPANHYVFAYKCKTSNTLATTNFNVQLKYKFSGSTGSPATLGTLSATGFGTGVITANTLYCFVLKRPTVASMTSTTPTYFGVYDSTRNIGVATNTSYMLYYNLGNTGTPFTGGNLNVYIAHQVLCTPTRSW